MDTLTGLYILLQLDAIKSFLYGLTFTLGFTAGIALLMLIVVSVANDTTEYFKKYGKYVAISASFAFFLDFVNALIPTTERAALMVVGAKVIDSNTTSILSNIPEKYAKILEQKADAYMKEMEKTQ